MKAKTPNGKAFNIKQTLTYLTKFAQVPPKTDADLAKVAVGCSANHHNLKDAVVQDVINCLQIYGTKWEAHLDPNLC